MSAADYGLAAGDGAAAIPGVSALSGGNNASYSDAVVAAPMPSSSSPSSTTTTTSTSVPIAAAAPSALREDQVSNAVSFLVHPKVRSYKKKRAK